jgi:hypothetical protein
MNSALHHYSAAQHQTDRIREARRHPAYERPIAVDEPTRPRITSRLVHLLARPRVAGVLLERR